MNRPLELRYPSDADVLVVDVGCDPTLQARAAEQAVQAFVHASASFGAIEEPADLLRIMGESLCELLNIERCGVFLRNAERELFECQTVLGPGAGPQDHVRSKSVVCGTIADGLTAEIVNTLTPVAVSDVLGDPRPVKSAMREWDCRAVLGTPIVVDHEAVGLLFVDSPSQRREFDSFDLSCASCFGQLAGTALAQFQQLQRLKCDRDAFKRENALLRRMTMVDQRFRTVVTNGGLLGGIAATAAELSGKPCEIYDDALRIRAAAPHSPAYGARFLRDDLPQPELREALRDPDRRQPFVVGPVSTLAGSHRLIVAPILIGEERRATLVLGETERRFGSGDLLVARRAAAIAALEISADARAAAAHVDAGRQLATELLLGSPDAPRIAAQAGEAGIDLSARVVCVFGPRTTGGRAPDPDRIRALFNHLQPTADVIAALVPEGTACLAKLDDTTLDGIADIAREVCLQATPHDLIVGISGVCSTAEQYGHARFEAAEVLQCIRVLAPSGSRRSLLTRDLGSTRSLLATADRAAMLRLAETGLGALHGPGGEDAVTTLEAFLQCGGNARRASIRLNVHPNTVRYRLGRIYEQTGLDVASNLDDQIRAHLAVLIMRYGERDDAHCDGEREGL